MERRRTVLGPSSLGDGEVRGYRAGGRHVLVARVNGRLRALDDLCNHGGCLLSGGRLEQTQVVCPCHEVGFDLDTGRNMTSPGVCDDQSVLQVVEEQGQLILLEP